ncbi:hypothetical protein QSH18_07320 [Xanthomonas sp. NCPPB 2654]|uniref:TolB family protein n=1 Tax=unclassified Xanthomonas TaxID=2643310 RepID=UPI0021DFC165|nr:MULTISPECIES: hypothetical protein [unclassified Xanthomonas]MDL5365412.1 hypothetical protein [Xanthomonas sp. NCPPB 2654]UYC20140.1 hypothetical protein NUG20_18565 [Xanthomonas sp. CFBP 8443]
MTDTPGGRVLQPWQRCEVWIADVVEGRSRLAFATQEILLEAPNWLAHEDALLLNGNGRLFRLSLSDARLGPVPISGIPPINNDHVVDRAGRHVYLSADDGHLYRAPVAGGAATRISEAADMMHFLHGIDPAGAQLAFIGVHRGGTPGAQQAQVHTMSTAGGGYRQLTHGLGPADGCEYSPDGQWLYFNTEAFDGRMQIARMRADGSEIAQLTFDDCANWFPHMSPDGTKLVYLAFPPGTQGHPGDVWVEIKRIDLPEWRSGKTLARVYGGQGSMNVNSWSADGRFFAYAAYPTAGMQA